jgi:hypothetical protein
MPKLVGLLAGAILAVLLGSAAWAQQAPVMEEIPDGYLTGTWGIGSLEACGAPTTELITFDASGSFGAAQGGQPTGLGFWQLNDDQLDLHMVSSPAFFGDHLQPFSGQYGYYRVQALLFDIQEHAFRMVAYMNGQLRGANLVRCP